MVKKKSKKISRASIPLILIVLLGLSTFSSEEINFNKWIRQFFPSPSYNIEEIPEYDGNPYVVINDDNPYFKTEEFDVSKSFERYSDLDLLGRCGEAVSNLGIDLMPDKERDYIGMIKPSGWHTVKYDFVYGKYLYNRCHLIGYQLTGQNANEKNLITCTRSMNAKTMLEFENKVANYIKETKNHVLYRVTPIFKGDELVARGVELEALSIEDDGKGIKFNVFIYNIEEGIEIDYSTGESKEINKKG